MTDLTNLKDTQLITPIRVVHDDIMKTSATKDQRPILEKYIPYFEKMVPEDRHGLIQEITHHLNSGVNPLAIEFSFITHIPQNIYREVYPLPEAVPVPINPDDEAVIMLRLQARIEQIERELADRDQALIGRDRILDQITLERDNAIIAKDQAIQQVEDRDRIIEERDQTITDLTEQNTELTNTVTEKDGTIDDLNDAIQNLREANAVNQSPQINELTHRLELVTVQKETLEQTLGLRNEEVSSLRQDKIELQQDKNELRADKQALTVEKTALIQEKIKLAGDITTFVAEIEVKEHRIEELSTQCQDYVGIMGACPQCMDAI